MRLIYLLCAFAIAVGAAPAAAQPRDIPLKAGSKYSHKSTRIALPPSLGGLPRARAVALDVDDLDVIVDYRSTDEREITTIYLYRNAAGDLPLWFDRANAVIDSNPARFGKLTPAFPAAAFVPPGQSTASGLRVVYSTGGSGFASTALAMVPVGEFFVKMRLSSATLGPAELEARMREALAAISWPRRIAPAPAAVLVAPCDSALAFSGIAKPAPKNGAAALIGALIPSLANETAKSGEKSAPVVYCRDARVLENAALYRPNGDKDRYLVAFQDAGRALQVGRNDLASIIAAAESAGDAGARYSVDLIGLSETQGFGDFATLPPPEQAIDLVSSSKPVYATSTIGKRNKITLASDALDNE
ncbi:MAG TPA: hypothetical protein VM346_00665 [Sphingomicrobium sp.]|nr:hypothetical protein [Sphingomicrobium sp.]